MNLPHPTPKAVRAARRAAGHTQLAAARAVHYGHDSRWSAAERLDGPGLLDMAKWELYLLLTGQHPTMIAVPKATFPKVENP